MTGTITGILGPNQIVTIAGERPADHIEPGDLVIALGQPGIVPVQRVTELVFDLRSRPEAAPVLVAPGALDEHSPTRPTALAPDTLVDMHGVMVRVGQLVNGTTIRRSTSTSIVTYVTIELERPEVIVADGVRVGTSLPETKPCFPVAEDECRLQRLRAFVSWRERLLAAGAGALNSIASSLPLGAGQRC